MKISISMKGMVTIDGESFSYSNIRDMYKNSNGISLSTGRDEDYRHFSIKDLCNNIADILYSLQDICGSSLSMGTLLLDDDYNTLHIFSKASSYLHSRLRKHESITYYVAEDDELREDEHNEIKRLCGRLPPIIRSLNILDIDLNTAEYPYDE